ncbi:CD209 antigen-like protein A [Xenopus laevis]|uniref:C-type lectin domain-containing protein n=2 Tax=Xenopus laevis TaxID=8355 RepID=A0A974CE35_XENLA|nr:CD209 antigen-like protein A [Xenopus laevis]OCT71514.1 hypothetical protein XELAEV_18034490mg [Xenopus laevis]
MRRLKKPKGGAKCLLHAVLVPSLSLLKLGEVAIIVFVVLRSPCKTTENSKESSQCSTCPVTSQPTPVTENPALIDLCVTNESVCKLCPLNWMEFNEKCYYFSDSRSSWASSMDNCKNMKADIISMEDPKEEEFISGQVNMKSGHFWIGLIKRNSVWYWKTDEKFKTSIQVLKGSREQNCTTFGKEISAESCSNPNKWICEKNASMFSTLRTV